MEPSDRDIVSESDMEIVWGDGTVTDKADGIRRPYSEHIAQCTRRHGPAAGDRLAVAPASAPITKRAAYAIAAGAGAIGAAVAVVVERLAG